MIHHKNTLVALDIFLIKFQCDLKNCKGKCCVEGTYGAPLAEEEISEIEKNLPEIIPFMSPAAIKLLNSDGFYETDPEGVLATKCINNANCIFSFESDGIHRCTIERAFHLEKITFRKPISCHLYPIRLNKIGENTGLNYQEWSVCKSARALGKQTDMPLYKYLGSSLTRRFGKEWYKELRAIGREIERTGLKF